MEEEKINLILQLKTDTARFTGLYNPAFLVNSLESEIERSNCCNTPLSIVMIDIDDFYKISNIHDRQVCDGMLGETADIINQVLRPSDTVGRYGSGEFLLILPNTDCDGACAMTQKIQGLIAASPFMDANLKFTISASVASWEKHKAVGPTPPEVDNLLLQRATG